MSNKKELKSSAQRPKTERAFGGNLLERASDSEELLASEEHSQAQSLSVFPDWLYLGKAQMAMLG